MRLSPSEKAEIIRLVEESPVGVNRTLKELGIGKSTFYNWYHRYHAGGIEALQPRPRSVQTVWNQVPESQRQGAIDMALEYPALSCRELACRMTDQGRFISESSVYRILKKAGLITSPVFAIDTAADRFHQPTERIHQLWQTDFTYFRIVNWGWYYLATVMDDFSRYIITWKLCSSMKATDANEVIGMAIDQANLQSGEQPKLLSDNGSCYISGEFAAFLQENGITHTRGRPMHPQTQGKIERYHRSLKSIIKLDNYYSPEELERRIAEFVAYYNHHRYHESLNNLTPEMVYTGNAQKYLHRRRLIKERTLQLRRKNHFLAKAKSVS